MYPNPQDTLPLPLSPDIGQYRKRAKDLTRACRSGDPATIAAWARQWVDDLIVAQRSDRAHDLQASRERRASQITAFAGDRMTRANCALSQAQFVIARAHGFASWPRLVQHLEQIAGPHAPATVFERAADAIVHGEEAKLERLLHDHPSLPRARSDREHRATLLHYVSANGVENWRQVTPANIVAIATRLLDAGAEVDAECDVYGGGATTLYLAVTSAHPKAAGVQNDLADLLLERGARLRPGIIRHCLANGCPEAAHHLMRLGAPLSLEEAAGLGEVALVRRQLDVATPADTAAALLMACWYDQREVVKTLLDAGVSAASRDADSGETPLHVAAWLPRPELVQLLLRHGAPVAATDARYGTTPIHWALHGWLVEHRRSDEAYRGVVRRLVEAGAVIDAKWHEHPEVRALLT